MASDKSVTASDASNPPSDQQQPHEPHEPHEDYTERLRRLGVRVTPQRLFVLEALELTGGHTTAEEVMRWVSRRYPALNLATVYRALDVLVSVGLVAQTNLGGGASYYELVGDSPHHHLACERCGQVIEMDESLLTSLQDDALRIYGFHARPRHLAIFGLCQECYLTEHPQD